MRRVLALSVLMLTVVTGAVVAQEKPRIAVLEFENKAGVTWWYETGAGAAQDVFVTELVKSGKFRVLDRAQLNRILEEQNLSASGRIDGSTAVRMGKVVGVKYFLTGALTEWEQNRSSGRFGGIGGGKSSFKAVMNARLIDAETGDILWADEADSSKSKFKVNLRGIGGGNDYSVNTISTLIKPIVQELTEKLVYSGTF